MVLRQEDIFSEREDIFLRGNIFLREKTSFWERTFF